MMPAELERLRERVRRDPFSRLFISLADELRKAGMRGEAIQVLWDGLERHPGYMSARVALGKLYIEENDLKGALSEFRQVADAIPDNLLAQRKLADIYMLLEDREGARRALEMVVRLNPMDSDAKAALDKLNSAPPAMPGMEESPEAEEGIFEAKEEILTAWESPEGILEDSDGNAPDAGEIPALGEEGVESPQPDEGPYAVQTGSVQTGSVQTGSVQAEGNIADGREVAIEMEDGANEDNAPRGISGDGPGIDNSITGAEDDKSKKAASEEDAVDKGAGERLADERLADGRPADGR
nr:tetratricopeptide repeat protein [Nitrospiraceae bacterium]